MLRRSARSSRNGLVVFRQRRADGAFRSTSSEFGDGVSDGVQLGRVNRA